MSCFSCVPPPASLKPRKIYNILVPDVFPLKAPDPNAPLPGGITRKIGKLQEYIQNSPDKIPKVSRRLFRRITKAVEEGQHGFVLVGVHAYMDLLDKSTEDGSGYSFNYFSKELVHQPNALILKLVSNSKPVLQALGAQLLVSFIKSQDAVENQVAIVDQLILYNIATLLGYVPKPPSGTPASLLRIPVISVQPSKDEAVKASCLLSLREYLLLSQRMNVAPTFLEAAVACVLSTVDVASPEIQSVLKRGKEGEGKTSVAPVQPHTDGRLPESSAVAFSAMRCFRPLLQDVSIMYRVLEAMLRSLDTGNKWEQNEYTESLLGLIRHACGDQTFPLFSSLLRHSSSEGLSIKQRKVVIGHAAAMGGAFSLSAMRMTLMEMPKVLIAASVPCVNSSNAAVGGSLSEQEEFKQFVMNTVQSMAACVGDASQLFDVVAGLLKQRSTNGDSVSASLDLEAWEQLCCLKALESIADLKEQARLLPGRDFPSVLIRALAQSLASQASALSSSAPASKHLLEILILVQTLLFDSCGLPLPEDRSAIDLLSLAAHLALNPSSGPRELSCAASLTALSSTCSTVHALHQFTRALLALRTLHLQSEPLSRVSIRQAAGLLLTESMLLQLAAACGCPTAETLHCQALEQSVEGLKLGHLGVGKKQLPVLLSAVPSRASFSESEVANKAALSGIEAVRGFKGGALRWNEALVAAIQELGVLDKQSCPTLPNLLSEPTTDSEQLLLQLQTTLMHSASPLQFKEAQTTAAAKTMVSDPEALRRQVQQFPDRVQGGAWGLSRTSVINNQANLEQVLVMLDKKAEGRETTAEGSKSPVTTPFEAVIGNKAAENSVHTQSQLPNASINEVLDLVSNVISNGSEQGFIGSFIDLNVLNFRKQLHLPVV
ncbi:hypothetical protein CEUSTIGMA_g344.t1 [Chlamydomonas eustigma]|uniref:Uncharacterized protein n=1 Tax=Chlamydomonas eustigma TaxID=1157962 RepID=A0A250WQC3_9CHLO|nr:hypothetical protein CEUSTIGMA_g344.t1 [Chlamydomonas eustigma]|eukprot:GAX72889.1 hypothetical protein CEUSTIGMA_g344.t1 [Chlamydomonas eustigma]